MTRTGHTRRTRRWYLRAGIHTGLDAVRKAGLRWGAVTMAAGALGAPAALASCTTRGSAPPPRRAGQAVTLEFWGGPSGDQRKDQVAAWNARQPAVQVRFQAVPAVGQGVAALRPLAQAVAAHTAPPILDFDRFQVTTYANWRVLRPLDDLIAQGRMSRARFLPITLEEATGFDNKLYGLPSSVDNRLFFWNKEQFADAGLDPDRPPATWDELTAVATRLVRTGGGSGRSGLERLGFHADFGQATLHLFAWQNGGGFQSADEKTATLPLPANAEALHYLADLMRGQGGWPAASAFRATWGTGARHPFLTGQLAMQHELPNWAGDVLAKHRPDLPFGVAQPPLRRAGDSALTWAGGYSYVISRESAHTDAAWSFLQWLLDEEAWTVAHDGQRARARAAGGVYLPGMAGQAALDAALLVKYKTGLPLDGVLDAALALMAHARIRERSIAAADLWDGVLRAQTEALTVSKEVERALADQNIAVQRALDQAWTLRPAT